MVRRPAAATAATAANSSGSVLINIRCFYYVLIVCEQVLATYQYLLKEVLL
jgi:hypothetical protein